MTDEEVSGLNMSPEEFPNIGLWSSRSCDKIASHLNMASINDWALGINFFSKRNQSRHLRVVNDNDISTTICT
jgi:hypothetical protein